MNVLPMANFQAPEVQWMSLAPILIVLGGAVLGILLWYAFDRLLDVTLPLGAWLG